LDWFLLIASLAVILLGAQLFTNGVEWVGEGFGLSQGAVGSVLAAIGTALPETILPIIAIAGSHGASGDEIGIGAILGAPFMLTTLAMCLVGVSLAWFSRGGRRPRTLRIEPALVRMDLVFFMVMYAAALAAGVWHATAVRWTLAPLLLAGYVIYVRRHFAVPQERELDTETTGEIRPLLLLDWAARVFRRAGRGQGRPPPVWASVTQTLVALLVIVGGARIFVTGIQDISMRFHLSPLVFSLLIAPVATELPELFNSVLWIRRRKDTLALGNVTGAMVFQSSFPVSIGLLLTPWHLSQEGLVAGVIALVAGLSLYVQVRARRTLGGVALMAQALLFAVYVVYVLVRS
jgi:cation:H+ antiporter